MTSKPVLTSEEEAILHAYRRRELTVARIRRTFAITQTRLYGLLTRAREPFRRSASARPGRLPQRRHPMPLRKYPDAPPPDAPPPGGTERLECRLRRLLTQRVAELECEAAAAEPGDKARIGQALALAARTLATLRGVASKGEDDAADTVDRGRPARSLGELRDELLGHLERIRDEERSRRGLEAP